MLKSRNFWTNIVSLVMGLLASAGATIGVDIDPAAGDQLTSAISTGNIGAIVMVGVNFLNPVQKIIKSGAWKDKLFLSSTNFLTNLVTFVLATLGTIGLAIPEDATNTFVAAIGSMDIGALISAVAINIINPIIHMTKDKNNVEEKLMNIKLQKMGIDPASIVKK